MASTLSAALAYVVCYSTVLMAVELMFCLPNLPRRPHAALRFLVVLTVYAVPLNSYAITRPFVGTWAMVPYALVQFLVSLVALRLLFRASWAQLFFFGSASYAVEGILFIFRRLDTYFPRLAGADPAALATLSAGLCALTLALVWHLLVCRYRDGGAPSVDNKLLLLFVGATILVTDILSTWVRIEGLANAPFGVCSLLCYVLLLALEFDVFRVSALEHERDLMRRLSHERERQQAAVQESIETVNVKFHDLKHQIAALRSMESGAQREKSLEELDHSIQMYDASVRTGDPAIDAILTEKSMQCWSREIEFSCMVDGTCLSGLGVVDAYVLLGNALDNAMEAAVKVSEYDGRIVTLLVERRGELAYVCVENSCVGRPQIVDGMPVSTKGDPANHGFGLRSILSVVRRHGGNLVIDADEGFFSLCILLPLDVPAPTAPKDNS